MRPALILRQAQHEGLQLRLHACNALTPSLLTLSLLTLSLLTLSLLTLSLLTPSLLTLSLSKGESCGREPGFRR